MNKVEIDYPPCWRLLSRSQWTLDGKDEQCPVLAFPPLRTSERGKALDAGLRFRKNRGISFVDLSVDTSEFIPHLEGYLFLLFIVLRLR